MCLLLQLCLCVFLQWGVQLPCSKGSYVSAGASATLATAAGADEGHSPVLAFYLGKAGVCASMLNHPTLDMV
jgi:hypothetical protein